MSTLFTITSGNLTDSIFARTISDADTTSVSAVMGIGTTPVDITTFLSDGSSIWGVSFNVKSRSSNPTGLFSCKLFDSFNEEMGSLLVPISNFPAGDGSNNIDSIISQSWQTLKFDDPIPTSGSYYIRLSASTDGELYFYGLPQLDETIVDFASNSDITPTGNVSQGSFNPFNTKAWSVFLNNGAHIFCATNASVNLFTTNFTIDFWCYLSEQRENRLASFDKLNIDVSPTNTLLVSGVDTSLPVQQNTWTHIAVTRTSNVLNGYVNGTKSADITIANNLNFGQANLFIGRDRTATTTYMHGHIYNFRIVLNQALYSTSFSRPTNVTSKVDNGGADPSTPPSEENVKFLILDGKNYLNGVNETQLVNGSLTIFKSESPYNNVFVDNIGSFYNDGHLSLDTLIPSPQNGAFTFECYFKYDETDGYHIIWDGRADSGNEDNRFVILINNTNIVQFYYVNFQYRLPAYTPTDWVGMYHDIGTVTPNTWHHIALSRPDGGGSSSTNYVSAFINGIYKNRFLLKWDQRNDNTGIQIWNWGAKQRIGGTNRNSFVIEGQQGAEAVTIKDIKIKNFRITDNLLYNSNFTPSPLNEPLANTLNTKLLLNFTGNTDIIYEKNRRQIHLGGDPRILANNIEGRGSINFDGFSYIRIGRLFDITPTNFTIQCKFKLNADKAGGWATIMSNRSGDNYRSWLLAHRGDTSLGIAFYYSENNTSWQSGSPWILVPQSQVTYNTVYDIALQVSNSTITAYVNGIAVSAAPLTTGQIISMTDRILVGSDFGHVDRYFKGSMDNICIHNRALYTGNFTPAPTYYYNKDAIIWIDGNGASSADFNKSQVGFVDGSGNTTFTNNGNCCLLKEYVRDYRSYIVGPNDGSFKNVTLDYIDRPRSEKYYISNSTDFTVESWVKSNTATNQGILNIFDGGLSFGLSAGKPFLGKTNGPILLSSISAVNGVDSNWHHLAVSRSAGTLSLFVDGRLSASTTDTTEFSAGKLRLFGDFGDPVNIFDGYLADIRLTNGQALYTSTFTPPTATITNTSNGGASPSVTPIAPNVVLLYADNPSVNPTSVITYPTLGGNAVLTQAPSAEFSPFMPEETYNPVTHGGSIYFDGTNDLVSVSERTTEFTFGTGDFNVEFWFYPTNVAANHAPLLTWQDSSDLADGIMIKFATSTKLQVLLGNDNTESVTLESEGTYLNQWSHIAVSRKNNVYRLFVNGNLRRSAFFAGLNLSNDNDKLKIGEACKGYIADVRVVKGQALYVEDFTPSNTSLTLTNKGATGPGAVELTTTPNLLIKGIKSGVYDGSANNNILQEGSIFTVSLADTINADANYTDNALKFNGVFSNNYLVLPASPALDLAGDFWIDFWMNTTKWKRDTISRRILTLGSVSSVSAFHVCLNATGTDKKLQIFSNTNILSSNFDYADGLWHHVGIGRSGSTLSLYRDGVLDTSAVNTVNYNSGVANSSYIGIYGDATPNKGRYDGKLVGLRIINGECVHTSNYSIPAEPATLTSDGGTGTNNLGNVSLFMKLNNIVSPVNNHVITSEVQSLTGAISNPKTGIFTTYNNIVSSNSIPTVAQGAPAGSRSIYFDATNNSHIVVPTTNLQMNGDWTIEGYFRPISGTSEGGFNRILMNFDTAGDNLQLSYLNGEMYLSHTAFTLKLPYSEGVWRHVAACRKGNEISLYSAGQRVAGSTITLDNANIGKVFKNAATFTLGGAQSSPTSGSYHGFMYRPRIIDGRALYDGNFNTNIPLASTLSATADTVFLYVDATSDVYYRPGHLEKVVIGGSVSNENVIDPITITTSLSYWALNNVSIQNYGTFTSPTTSNNTFNITNNGLKIGSGGTFILSSAPGYRKVLNMDESRIHVLAGGALDIRGQQKTIKATLTGDHTATRSVFTLNETPTNWLSGDSLIFLPPSANSAQFEELSTKSVLTNRLSTTTNSLYAHQYLAGIPSIANATRNFAIKGLSTNRRGWLQFDKTSNTYICDTEFEHLGRSTSKKVGSIVLNVKPGGSFLLSGCYLDGSTSTGVDATTLYGRSSNVTIRDTVFYKYAGNAFAFNNIADNFNINDNIILRSGKNGIKLQNATLGETCNFTNNISLGNTERGTYIENAEGNIEGSVNWYNTQGGLYLAKPTTGENKDMSDEDIEITEEATTNLVSFDTPLSEQYPDETSTFPFTKRLIWPGNSKYIFLDDFTIEAFLKFSVNNTNAFNLMGNYSEAELGAIILSYQSNTQTFRLKTYETTFTTRASATLPYLPINTWHHIAICRKDDSISVYLNGSRIMLYNSSFEYKATDGGIALGWGTDLTNKGVYGFRILNRAEYDSVDTITVPSTPFVFDNETLLLYKRTVKTGVTKINNILNNINGVGGMFIDNSSPSLKNTTISNISCTKNTGYGISIDGSNVDYREANSLTAIDILTRNNDTIGLNLNNMTGVLTGVLAIDNSTTNIQLKLGDGITKVKSVTGLVASNIPNMIIYSSKSFRPVIFDDIYLNKNTTMTSAYSAVPLHIRETDFLNFHFDNSTLAAVSTGFAVTLSGTVLGTYQFSNTVTTDAGVQNLSCLPPDNIKSGGIIFMNKNKNKGSHESFYRKGKRATDTSVVAGNIAEKITPSSLTDRFKSGSKFVAVSSNDAVKIRMKVTTTVNGDARLMLKKNSSLGFDDDVLLYPISNSSTFTTTSPSASGVGIMEFFVDCTGTTGSVIIDDWKAK